MSAFFILVSVSILVAATFLGAFIWSVHNDQYSDIKGSSMRILFDDDSVKNNQ
ncbi:cbb3-type cytochrome oxidase assembly protein CcoS [Nemorincola caseinilytica]|uniref:cbb3-type cytochrome oxidase assembly protein CcoS n=1 Tax=Nemorincola caseinilytica TaxID=2054315 RepID=UPI0031E8D052